MRQNTVLLLLGTVTALHASDVPDADQQHQCRQDTGITLRQQQQVHHELDSAPVLLYGWSGCPCTSYAQKRLQTAGACYGERVYPTQTAPMYKYMQCLYGDQHHSFVFFGGKFVGNGFRLAPPSARIPGAMPDVQLRRLLSQSKASLTCKVAADDKNLIGGQLESCSDSSEAATGWTRSGSCVWEPSDSGFHQVCVTMSNRFLRSSAQHDSNDLSSVVQEGGHWCICAWAWASAVARDPEGYEGIQLHCERTHARLRNVYQQFLDNHADITSPSGRGYNVKQALDAVNRLCPQRAPPPAPAPVVRAANSQGVMQSPVAPWRGTTWEDLHNEYGMIFKHGNRNAASHLWSAFLIDRAPIMPKDRFMRLSQGYCPVSGSPVHPSARTRWRYTLPNVDGETENGVLYHCCWPCVCDTKDFVRVDTVKVQTAEGEHEFRAVVIGDPCVHEAKLSETFVQPFDGRETNLLQEAPELKCQNGKLVGAKYSSRGHVIIGMLFDDISPTMQKLSSLRGSSYFMQDTAVQDQCKERAAADYNSGMGQIFRRVAMINPIDVAYPVINDHRS